MQELNDLTHFIKKSKPNNAQIIEKIHTLQKQWAERRDKWAPKKIIAGDIIKTINTGGTTGHPAVVVKVGRYVQCIQVSSKNKPTHSLMPYSDRLLGKGWFTPNIVTIDHHEAIRHYVGVFDDTKQLNKCIRKLKTYYKKTLNNAHFKTKKKEKVSCDEPLRQDEDTKSI